MTAPPASEPAPQPPAGRAPPRDYRHYSHEEIARAITEAHGLVSLAARALGCTPKVIRTHVKQSALVREAIDEARALTLDSAEASLYNQVLAGEGWAVCFMLKTLGKDRGYVERQDRMVDLVVREYVGVDVSKA